jgi:transposase-like protein
MEVDAKKPNCDFETEALSNVKRWSAKKKTQVVLRLIRGESLDSVSRQIGLPAYILEEWRQQALEGIESSLKMREHDPLSDELNKAMRRIGELSMENELLKERCRIKNPLQGGRSKR